MCDFDSQYDIGFPSLCKAEAESDCTLIPIDSYDCPKGYVKLQNPKPGCQSSQVCDTPGTYGSVALNLCAYQPYPDGFDTKAMVNCCTYKTGEYNGGKPDCPRGYCSRNQNKDSPCIIAKDGYISMTEYCVQKGLSDNDCRNFLINTTSQYAREYVLSAVLNPMLNFSNNDKIKNTANEQITQICNNPNLKLSKYCDDFLNKYCTGITDRQTIFNNPSFTQVCGCHLDKSVYITSPEDPNGICDPICNEQNTVPNNNQICNLDICIFDANVLNSVINGNINIEQVCGTSGNRCYFSDRGLDTINQLGNKFNFESNCKECFSYDEKDKVIGTNITKIKCPETIIPTPYTFSPAVIAAITIGSILVLVLIGVLLIF